MTTSPHGSYRKWLGSTSAKQQVDNARPSMVVLLFAFIVITAVASGSLYLLLAITLNIAGERDLVTNRQLYGIALGICVLRGFDMMMYTKDRKK